LFEAAPPPPMTGGRTLVRGTARGRVVGGNLTVLCSLVGTPYLPDLAGAILLLEDVGERPYRLDRLWHQLLLAGLLDHVAGVAIGDLSGCDDAPGVTYDQETPAERPATALEVFAELTDRLGVPAVAGLPFGHVRPNHAAPLGVPAVLDAGAGTLTWLEGACNDG
jgi:muramoyltetrapeptide carboxypeptidase